MHTQLHTSPCVWVCMRVCAHACTHRRAHHAHKREDSNTNGGTFDFPKRGLLCQYHIILASAEFLVSDSCLPMQTPAVVLSPARTWTRKQHTIRLLSGVLSSLWDMAAGGFSICSVFMLHKPINTFPAPCSEHCIKPKANLTLKNTTKEVIYN